MHAEFRVGGAGEGDDIALLGDIGAGCTEIEVAREEDRLRALADDLDRTVGAERRLGLVVELDDLDRLAEDAAGGVDLLDRELGAGDRVGVDRLEPAAEGHDQAEDRLVLGGQADPAPTTMVDAATAATPQHPQHDPLLPNVRFDRSKTEWVTHAEGHPVSATKSVRGTGNFKPKVFFPLRWWTLKAHASRFQTIALSRELQSVTEPGVGDVANTSPRAHGVARLKGPDVPFRTNPDA